jgi:hypothetical protein
MAVKPVTPKQVLDLKYTVIPDFVVEVFNEMLIKELSGKYATLSQKEVVKAILDRMEADYQPIMSGHSNGDSFSTFADDESSDTRRRRNRDKIFKGNWLDIEPIFRKAGWEVSYDRPGFNETYEPTWKFSAK